MAGYTVVVRAFADTTTFGPGDVVLMMDDIHNLAWTEYINDVGEAFFTVSQSDEKIHALREYIDIGAHLEIRRNGTLVWAGWLGEADETYEDAIIYGYSYVSGLYTTLSTWGQEWTATGVHTIMDALWDAAVAKTKSRIGWMTVGTVQDLRTTSGGATTLEMPLYKIYYKRVLDAFKELAAYAISDTTNRVAFEVTPAGVFNLWRSRGNDLNDLRWRMGEGGLIRGYRRIRMPVDRRSNLLAVGSSPNDVELQYEAANTTLRDSMGRTEEPVFLQWARDQAELERVLKLRLSRAGRVDTDLLIMLHSDSIVPFRASGQDYQLGDQITVYLNRGLSRNTSDTKLIVGQQVVYTQMSENVRLLLADRL